MPILIGADVGGSKTAVGVSEGADVLVRADGPGAAVRPGRALASAGMIAEVVRRALAGIGRLSGDVLLVGAAGAGRDPERSELAKALRGGEPRRARGGDDRHRAGARGRVRARARASW